MIMSSKESNVSPFIIPQTPRTEISSKMNGSPEKFKSPNSRMMDDVTMSLNNMSSSFSSPNKDALNTTINPQSKNNSKRK